MDSGWSGPTPSRGATRTRTPGGASIPVRAAISAAVLPTSSGLGSRSAVTRAAARRSASPAFRKYPPCRSNSRRASPATASSTTTEFSDEQSRPLSKVLPVMMSATAFGKSAVRSM